MYALLEFSAPADAMRLSADQLEAILRNALNPLALKESFLGRLLATVYDSIIRMPTDRKHIRLLVYTPVPHPLPGTSWGFFRTIKNGGETCQSEGSIHEIALYLYAEGPSADC